MLVNMESVWCTERTRILQIVLFIGLYFVNETTAQKCHFNPEPCRCSYGTLTCSSLEEIAALRTEVGNLNITSIELWNGNITSLSSNSLPPGLEDIYFYNQPLATISDDAFINSAQTLNSLTISDGHLRQLPKALLVLTNLTSLHIQDNLMLKWNDSILAHIIANITYLQLQNVSLTTWPGSVSLSHVLSNLDLSDNPLNYIPEDAFLSLNKSLLKLDLGHTGLTKFPMALSTLSNLTSLDLSGNTLSNVSDIEQLASAPFADILLYLTLKSSQLKTIMNFSSFTSLRLILLSNNSISDVSTGSFPISLTYLYLDTNLLPSVPTSIVRITGLSELNLSHNQITNIEPGTLPPNLSKLDLSHNQITTIEPDSLPLSLTRLDLRYNIITVITNTTFINMANLTNLQLSYNPISTIEPLAFSDLVSLKTLYLFYTSLKEIPLAFASLPPGIDFDLIQLGGISCPCPPHQELVDWFKLTNGTAVFLVSCEPYQSVEQYLTTGCVDTTTTTTTTTTDRTPGGASTLQCRLFSAHGCVLFLVTMFLFFFPH